MTSFPVKDVSPGIPSRIYGALDRLFEHPVVFNAYQTVVDGGKLRQIRRLVDALPYESVLDVGCGTGNWTRLARGPYLGVDTSPSFIEACRVRFAGDRQKEFVLADAAELEPNQRFDLGLMVSVLHHLSDEKALAVMRRLAIMCRYVLILDLYPISWNPASRLLYALDRGDFIRSPDEQRMLIDATEDFRLLKLDSYFSPTFLYRHTLFLLATQRERHA